jgi:hypothetical protein
MSRLNRRGRARFDVLVEKEATGTITLREGRELEQLQRVTHPMTPAEKKFDAEQSRVTRDLVDALQAYVDFHRR